MHAERDEEPQSARSWRDEQDVVKDHAQPGVHRSKVVYEHPDPHNVAIVLCHLGQAVHLQPKVRDQLAEQKHDGSAREQDAEEPILDIPPKYGDPEPEDARRQHAPYNQDCDVTRAQVLVTLLEEDVRVYLSGDEAGEADHPRCLPQTSKGGCRSQVECARVRSVMRLDRSHEAGA